VKRVRKPVILLVAAAALTLAAGAGAPLAAEEQVGGSGGSPFVYWPLADGNWWRLADADVEMVYSVSALAPGQFRVDLLLNNFVIQREFYHSDEAGWIATLREHPGGSFPLNPPQVFLKNPLVPGDEWTWEGEILPGFHMTARFAVLEPEVIEAPAGQFLTLPVVATVTAEGESATVIRWFAEGVGIVRQQEVVASGGQSVMIDMFLIDYEVQ